MFALIPIFWLFRLDGRWGFKTRCAAISYAALTNPRWNSRAPQVTGAIHSIMLAVLDLLIPGVFAYVVEQRKSLQAVDSEPVLK